MFTHYSIINPYMLKLMIDTLATFNLVTYATRKTKVASMTGKNVTKQKIENILNSK